jgi:hypothetical protein
VRQRISHKPVSTPDRLGRGKINLGFGCCPNPQNSFPDKGLLVLRKVDQYSSREYKAGNRDPAIIDCRQWEEMNMPKPRPVGEAWFLRAGFLSMV